MPLTDPKSWELVGHYSVDPILRGNSQGKDENYSEDKGRPVLNSKPLRPLTRFLGFTTIK